VTTTDPAPPAVPPAALPAALLWDMDGTLVDTEPYWIAAEHALVAEHGERWDDDDARSLVGRALLDAAAVLRERGGVRLAPERIVEVLSADVRDRVRARVPWMPGARELLADAARLGVPCALVTMSWAPLAQAVVEALPDGAFAAVVTGDAVARGKPHPEPYLTAAAALGVDPARCVALEDSLPGVTSATAAGVPTVGVEHLVALPRPPHAPPGLVVVGTLEGLDVAALSALAATATRGA
jgi:HAD superfamily hydrolase (TIGR01509 family)